jgi:hypothetical protein
MPRYYFGVRNGHFIHDPSGTILPDDEAARAFAKKVIEQLMQHGDARQYAGWTIDITTDDRTVGSIPFRLDDPEDQEKSG